MLSPHLRGWGAGRGGGEAINRENKTGRKTRWHNKLQAMRMYVMYDGVNGAVIGVNRLRDPNT